MAGREITLKIKVDDKDVPKAEASLKRLDNAARNVGKTDYGLRQTRPGMASNAEEQQRRLAAFMGKDLPNAAGKAEQAISAVEGATAGATSGMGELATAAGPVGIAIAAVTVAAVAAVAVMVLLAQKIFELSKAYAEYAVKAANAAEQQGLQLETSIALNHELKAQGRTYLDLNGAIDSFKKTIGEAAAGSVDARAKLQLLGIDAGKAINDIDGAFNQAAQSIADAPNQFEAVRRAVAAFGEDGYRLLPFFNEFKGNIGALKAKAEELGIQMSGKNVADARAFTRAFADVQAQTDAVTYKFGREFLPIVSDALSRVSDWFDRNQEGLNRMAKAARFMVEDVIWGFEKIKKWIDDHPILFRVFIAATGGALPSLVGQKLGEYYRGRADDPQSQGVVYSVGDPGTYMNAPTPNIDAIAAQQAYKPPKVKKVEKSPAEKQAEELRKMISDLNIELDYFGQKSEEAAMRQTLLKKGIFDVNKELETQLIALAKDKDAKIASAEATKKAEEAAKKYAETLKNLQQGIRDRGFDERNALIEQELLLEKEIELGRPLNEFERSRIRNARELANVRMAARNAGITDPKDLDKLGIQIVKEQQLTDAIRARVQARIDELRETARLKARNEAAKEFQQSLDDELASVMRLGKPLSTLDQTLQNIARSEHQYTEEQKAGMLVTAQRIDAVRELNRQHAELKDFFKTQLRYVFDGDFKGLMESWKDRFKDMFADKLADVFATSVLGFNPNQTNNPVAKPIVKSIDKTNDILNQILVRMGGSPVPGAGSSGFGGILNTVLGGIGGGNANGPGGTPNWNPNANGGVPPTGTIDADGNYVVNGNQSSGGIFGNLKDLFGGIFGNLKDLFSTGQGGIFAPQKNILTGKMSGLGGILGGAGGLMGLIGGLVGGRTGTVLGMAGMGMQLGAMFGPIGAIIGGVGGALLGVFQINKQRREDEESRTQALLGAEAAIRQEFDALMTQLRFGTIDPASAINQAAASSSNIRQQYIDAVTQLKDGKTRRIALSEVQQRIDPLIARKTAELKGLAEIADASAERSKRILPEFAGGVFISSAFRDFQRYNGMLPGSWTGRDHIPALLADREMVINPMQQANVIRNAGFDPFVGAGIPNYPGTVPAGAMAGGGMVSSSSSSISSSSPVINVQPVVEVTLIGVPLDQHIEGYLTSDRGERTQVKVIKKLKKSGDIS